jgi:hypothetical protein
MWQYMPLEEQQRAQSLIEDAGRRATADAPFAWLRFEADGASDGAALTATIWPGGRPDGDTSDAWARRLPRPLDRLARRILTGQTVHESHPMKLARGDGRMRDTAL